MTITTNDDHLAGLAMQAGAALRASSLQVTVAESCTGGGVAFILTTVPGSSAWFDRGFVVYSNRAKQDLLGVGSDTLKRHGAVSEQVAREMTAGALDRSGADIGLAVTGIAGPDGGTSTKPVGTVCFAWQRRGADAISTRVHFQGDRAAVRAMAIGMALQGLLDMLAGINSDCTP